MPIATEQTAPVEVIGAGASEAPTIVQPGTSTPVQQLQQAVQSPWTLVIIAVVLMLIFHWMSKRKSGKAIAPTTS
jgi:hypothetical protein